MEDRNCEKNLRAGPGSSGAGESRAPPQGGARSVYTEGSTTAMSESEAAKAARQRAILAALGGDAPKKRDSPKPAPITAPAAALNDKKLRGDKDFPRDLLTRDVLMPPPTRTTGRDTPGLDSEDLLSDSSEMSGMSLDSGGLPAFSDRTRRKRRSDDDMAPPLSKGASPKSKRGRGRPPTTGRYVGLAKAQADFNREKEEAFSLQAEEEIAEVAREARKTRATISSTRSQSGLPVSSPLREEAMEQISADLLKTMETSLKTIEMVATKSTNLKGTYVRYLKESVATIKMVFEEVKDRSTTQEIKRLEAQNARLQQQVDVLRHELEEMRKLATKPASQDLQQLLAEVSRTNIETFGNMLNARLAGLEDRLLPEPRRRPPLAADTAAGGADVPIERGQPKAKSKPPAEKRKKATTEAAGPSQTPATSVSPKEVEKRRKRKKTSMAAREAEQIRARTAAPSATDHSWSRVEPRGRKKKKGATKKSAPKKKKRKLRPLKSAAITLTLEKGLDQSVTYASILQEATSRIDLEEVGIHQTNKVRFRLARTGARILEVTGEDAQQKADALATRMREVLDRDVVKIARPVQRVDLLVSGLDDAATAADVTKAAGKEGGCPATDIRSGRITVGPRGARSVWLHVPTAAAKKLLASGRLQVGWVLTRVVLLAARPKRCYRCLDTGHLASSCQSPVDRSGNCFRCGKPGHKAADCVEKTSCFHCAELGRESNHVLGTNGCITTANKPPGTRKKRKAPSKAQPRKRPGADKAGASEIAPAMEVEA